MEDGDFPQQVRHVVAFHIFSRKHSNLDKCLCSKHHSIRFFFYVGEKKGDSFGLIDVDSRNDFK